MTELHEVELTIDSHGEVRVEIRGMKGRGCLEVTREMERLLGGLVLDREHTHEYDLQPEETGDAAWLRRGS
jgi:hypothetical protein